MDKVKNLCKDWSLEIEAFNRKSSLMRKNVIEQFNEMTIADKKTAIKYIDFFLFENRDIASYQTSLLNKQIRQEETKLSPVSKPINNY